MIIPLHLPDYPNQLLDRRIEYLPHFPCMVAEDTMSPQCLVSRLESEVEEDMLPLDRTLNLHFFRLADGRFL